MAVSAECGMVKVSIEYAGQLRCVAKHGPSGKTIETDAPVDNHGRGESFSPTDLVATALGACMETIMGIYAQRKEIDLNGLRIEVQKEMSADSPRRIIRLIVDIWLPFAESSPHIAMLKTAALSCPVHKTLNPTVEIPITWHFTE